MEEVATKAEESKETEVEIDLPEDTVTMDILLNTRECVVALGNQVFHYGKNASAYQKRTTWEKIVDHVGKIHGHNISKNY